MKDSERNIGCEAPGRGENDIILVPQPTNDPSDPLNWNKLRKEYHFWLLWIWGFIATVSVNWVGPVWNFSISNVGNINFAAFIGGILGMMWGGFVSDWCILYFSRRNKGILEPKFRLWTMVIPAIVNTAGLLMQGLGALSGVMWIMPAGFGMVFIAFGIGSGAAIAITYAIDCYPKMASEALTVVAARWSPEYNHNNVPYMLCFEHIIPTLYVEGKSLSRVDSREISRGPRETIASITNSLLE
ncbi:Major facilitator superfamily domain [Trichophyton rubrum]|nr:Major facilitator superfamily domain [Trichophyton rubrum]